MNKIGLLPKNLIVLSNEVGTHLVKPKKKKKKAKPTTQEKQERERKPIQLHIDQNETKAQNTNNSNNTWAALTEPVYEDAILRVMSSELEYKNKHAALLLTPVVADPGEGRVRENPKSPNKINKMKYNQQKLYL